MRKSLKGGIKNLNGLLLTLFSTLRDFITIQVNHWLKWLFLLYL